MMRIAQAGRLAFVLGVLALLAEPLAAAGLGCPACHPAAAAAVVPLWTGTARGVARPAPSALCLSCHDGGMASSLRAKSAGVGGHPVGVVYDAARSRRGLALRASVPAGLLVNGRVECTSCHDPHRHDDGAAALRIPQRADRLCVACHDLR